MRSPLCLHRPGPAFSLLSGHGRFTPLALAAALLCLPAQGQTMLPEVRVSGQAEAAEPLGLKLPLPARSASHTGIATKDLPASLDGVSGEQIQERGDYGMAEAVTRTVGLTVNSTPGNGGLAFGSRGFAGVNSVGVAEDGMVLGVAAGTVAYPGDSWGYERIDVLRGPASLMYGSGTMGATVNAVRKQPSRVSSAEMLVAAGTDDTLRLGLGATGALGAYASYRIDAYGQRSAGERDLDRSRGGKFMSTLRLEPRSDLQIDLIADRSEQNPSRYWGTPGINGQVVKSLRDQNYNAEDSVLRYEDERVRAKLQWKANDWLTVRNELYHVRSDRHWRNIESYAFNPATGLVNRSDYLEILHDLEQTGNRMGVSMDWGRHQLAMGWEVARMNLKLSNNSPYGGTSTVSAWNPDHGYWASPDPTLAKTTTGVTQQALYIEDAWRITDRWLLLAGMRRDVYDFSRHELVAGTDFDKTLGGTSWRLGLSYALTPATSLYGQFSTGHDPVTSLVSLNLANRGYALSKGRQAEVGIKQQLAQGRGEWTLAVFDLQKDDIITRDPDRPAISVQGGSQSSRGAEFTAAFQATQALRLEGNLSYVDAKFDTLLEAGGNRAGNRPEQVAKVTANLWGHYRVGAWQASLGLRHVGDRFGNNANTVRLPAYTVADAALSWQFNARTTLSLIGRNLTDRFYVASNYGSNQFLVGQGRRFELSAHIRF
jgi:iron complex outermembrane receptor protein